MRPSKLLALAFLAAFLVPLARSQSKAARVDAHPVELQPAEHRAALATGIRARWIELGAPEGEAVLFLHGWTDTSRSFLPTMRELARLRPELRLLALDQRGHGGSSLPSDRPCRADPERCFRPEDFAADARALLDHLHVERAHVVGHCLGSIVAQELALAQPERVARVVLIASTARFADNVFTKSFLQQGLVEGPWRAALLARGLAFPADAWALSPLDVDAEVERWLAENWVAELGADPALLAAILPETARTPLGTWIGVLRAILKHDNRQRLADLSAPALVIWPIQDALFGDEPDQRELRAALERANARHGTPWFWKRYGRVARLDTSAPQTDLGHNVHWAAPEAVARDLAAFLREGGAPTIDEVFLDGAPLRAQVAPGRALVLGSSSPAPARRAAHATGQCTFWSSTRNRLVLFGVIAGGAPRSPYASGAGMTKIAVPPSFVRCRPSGG